MSSRWRLHGAQEARRYAELVGGIRDDDVLLDIGANIGEVSRLWRSRGARAIAVEPNWRALSVIAGIEGVVCVEAAVVGHLDGPVTFVEAARDVCSWIEVAYRDETPGEQIVRRYQVPAVTFAELVERYHPTVIKIDVEGSEYLFAAQLAAVDARAIAIEWHALAPGHASHARLRDAELRAAGWEPYGDPIPETDFVVATRGYRR